MAGVAQCLRDVQFGFRGSASKNHLGVVLDQRGEFRLAKPVELITGHHGGMLTGNANSPSNGPRRERVIPGDHDDANPRRAALGDRVGDARARRIQHRDQAGEAQVAFDIAAALRYRFVDGKFTRREGEYS